MRPPRVLGIPSPWSGDERDPMPWTYQKLWFPAYVRIRRARHLLGIHDWNPALLGGHRCDWCGARR